MWFTMYGMCVKNKTIMYEARASNSKRDCEHDLYCCLLPRCEALRTYRSGFPIAILYTPKAAIKCSANFITKLDKHRQQARSTRSPGSQTATEILLEITFLLLGQLALFVWRRGLPLQAIFHVRASMSVTLDCTQNRYGFCLWKGDHFQQRASCRRC